MSKLDDSMKRAEEMKKLLDGPARNKIVRRYGAVEYRCERGCFLGAVVRHAGHEYLYTYSNTRVEEVSVRLGEHGEPLGISPGTVAYERVVHAVKMMKQSGWPVEHEILVAVDTINDMTGLDSGGDLSRDTTCLEWPYQFPYPGTINCNCRHSEMAKTLDEIQADIQRLARAKKKLIYVEPNPGWTMGLSDSADGAPQFDTALRQTDDGIVLY